MNFNSAAAEARLASLLKEAECKADVRPFFQQEFAKIQKDLVEISTESGGAKAVQSAVELFDEITMFINRLNDGTKPTPENYTELTQKLRLLRDLIPPARSDLVQNARARFANDGQWAIHYSTVRMTVTTFLVGLSWGIVALQWDRYKPALCFAAWAVWVLTLVLLFTFTFYTKERLLAQRRLLKSLPTPDGKPLPTERWWMKADKSVIKVLWYNLGDISVWIFLVATVGLWGLTQAWKLQSTNDSMTLVVPGYRETRTVTNTLTIFKFPLQHWQDSQQIFHPMFAGPAATNNQSSNPQPFVSTPPGGSPGVQPSMTKTQPTNLNMGRTNEP